MDIAAVVLTGEPMRAQLTPAPTCSIAEMESRWSGEPVPTDDVAAIDVFEARYVELRNCQAQWDTFRAVNFG